jgi:hypothetical protein
MMQKKTFFPNAGEKVMKNVIIKKLFHSFDKLALIDFIVQ